MPNEHSDDTEHSDDLNWLGKSVLLGSAAVHATTHLIDRGLERTAATVRDSKRAFKQGRDPNVEEATILDEREEDQPT